MCCILSCFGWALDLFQRMLTMVLACLLCCAVCTGLLVAVAAGVAYGYNYSMAEFLTFTKQDVTVYMRRGQFYDTPDLDMDKDMFSRRSSNEDQIGLVAVDTDRRNKSVDYQENIINEENKPFQETWKLLKDTRKYAELLTKYTPAPTRSEVWVEENESTSTEKPSSRISPNPLIHTTVILSGTSQILMRKFGTLASYDDTTTETQDEQMFYRDIAQSAKAKVADKFEFNVGYAPESRKVYDGYKRKHIPMRTATDGVIKDFQRDYREDSDEENFVYKPV